MKTKQGGFTLIELLVVITIIGILAALALPQLVRAKQKAKEAEVKSNLHSIQIALERYATDHSGQYPAYIFGGDLRIYTDGYYSENGCPKDSLIQYGYVSSYPKNPFTDGREVIDWTGSWGIPGTTDLRFGWNGTVMGNGFDDPRYFWGFHDGIPYLTHMWYSGAYPENPVGCLRYCWGGKPVPDRKGDSAWGIVYTDSVDSPTMVVDWPGNFGYRSAGRVIPSSIWIDKSIWDFPYIEITTYMLWGYGAENCPGFDVVRITSEEGHWMLNSDGFGKDLTTGKSCYYSNSGVVYSHPETFGGGGLGKMPVFPPYDYGKHEFLYGAPDGRYDGVILVLTPSGGIRTW